MDNDDANWIAQRKYSTESDGQLRSITIAVGSPRKLRDDERPFESPANLYGCPVQTGERHTQRMVGGRDPLEALFHALLSIDAFLVAATNKSPLVDESGRTFKSSTDGLLCGPIGRQYVEELLPPKR